MSFSFARRPQAQAAIALAGAGCVLATGIGSAALWEAACAGRSGIGPLQAKHFRSRRIAAFGHVGEAEQEHCRAALPAHLLRYAPPPVAWGLAAVRQALAEAGLEPQASGLRFGLYTSQGGYTHPSLDAYAELLHECRAGNELDARRLAARVLQERALDPFLVLKSLSNGLLGIVSLAYKLEGPCGAYMQGVAGNHAALREACAALRERRIDAAIVVAAGSELDALALADLARAGVIAADGATDFRPFDRAGRGGIAGEGAAALVLRRQADLAAPEAVCLTELHAQAQLRGLASAQGGCELLIASGWARPEADRRLAGSLARFAPRHIGNSQALTGILSGAPSLADLVLARQALQAQRVPGIAGLQEPVSPDLPFARASRDAPLRQAQVLNVEGNGFAACYRLERLPAPAHSTNRITL
ncbi:MAG: beta-ketoacyl synthase [Gammaproteobacteria bacterium]|nr:beta-ketoacyl synthase [Gammaproteobacteria bacterium]